MSKKNNYNPEMVKIILEAAEADPVGRFETEEEFMNWLDDIESKSNRDKKDA
jgi:hypothetical protein